MRKTNTAGLASAVHQQNVSTSDLFNSTYILLQTQLLLAATCYCVGFEPLNGPHRGLGHQRRQLLGHAFKRIYVIRTL